MHLRSLTLLLICAILPLRGEEPQPLSPGELGVLRKSHLPAVEAGVEVPLESTFAGFIVQIQINGKPVRLILDTGSCSTFLSAEVARKLGLKLSESSEDVTSASGGTVATRRALTQRISMGDAWTENEPVLVSEFPGGVDGLLGLSTLADWDVRIDPSTRILTLFPAGKAPSLKGEMTLPLKCENSNPEAGKDNKQRLRMLNISVPVRVGDHELASVPDTGHGGTLQVSSAFLEKTAPEAMKNAGPAVFSGMSISGRAVTRTVKVPEFTFGPDSLRDFPAEVMDVPTGESLEREGFVGLTLLRHYVMTFRFATGELRLKPLGTVQDITQASTAGLSLGQDFKLIETEPNGPAANAGLLAGDEILEFGGRPLKTMKMEDIIALKRLPPGTVLKVRYRRGESKPEETKMILEKQK